jgi:sarcosine oxidase, subunit gamma
MSDPAMQSPLHAFGLSAKATAVDHSQGVWVREIPLMGYISLRGNSADAAFVAAASKAIGAAVPIKFCTLSVAASLKVLWLSPDEWMIVCPRSELPKLLGSLKQSLTGIRHQAVDNSGGYTQVLLQGHKALNVLGHVTVYDVAALKPGSVVGTTLGKSSVYLHRQGDDYCLLLRRSFADYIWRYLVRAAEPYGLGIALSAGE